MNNIHNILDGWFGEPLAHAEDEDQKRKYLYGPLEKVFEKIHQSLKDARDDIETLYSMRGCEAEGSLQDWVGSYDKVLEETK